MDCTSSTSSAWLLVYVAMTAISIVWSAPTAPHYSLTSQTKGGLENVANVIITEVDKLCTEICKTHYPCDSSAEDILRKDLKLPEIKDIESGCLSTKFNKEKCLPKIYSDLLKFQTYLDFLKESMPGYQNIIEFIQIKSVFLANAIKHQHLAEKPSEDMEDTTPGITVADLRSNNPWNQNLTSYVILQSFKEYMEKTSRAVRNSVKASN